MVVFFYNDNPFHLSYDVGRWEVFWIMYIVTVNKTRDVFDEALNDKISELELKGNEIIDIKFTSTSSNNSAIILSALVMYKKKILRVTSNKVWLFIMAKRG